LILRAVESVTWIKVEKPTFDIVGLVLGALNLTGVLAAGALLLGVLLGVGLIRRGTRARSERTSLNLDATS